MFQRHSDSPLDRQTAEQLSEAVQAIGKWQEYLRNRDAGYLEAAQNSLQQVLEQRFEYPLLNAEVVRSALGKLQTQERDPADEVAVILKSVQKVSDIPSAAQSISKISPSRNDSDGLQGVSQRMRNYATIYAAFLYGSPENQGLNSSGFNSTSSLAPELLRIENLLRLDMLTQAYAPLNAGPPKEDENYQSYSARLIETAAKNKDWPSLEKILLFSAKGNSRPSDPQAAAQLSAQQAFNAARRYAFVHLVADLGSYPLPHGSAGTVSKTARLADPSRRPANLGEKCRE